MYRKIYLSSIGKLLRFHSDVVSKREPKSNCGSSLDSLWCFQKSFRLMHLISESYKHDAIVSIKRER